MTQSETSDNAGPSDKYPELLRDFRDKAEPIIEATGLPPETSRHLALQLDEMIRHNWGGIQIYIPRGLFVDLAERDSEIYRKWNGRNKYDLCRQYKISEICFCKIIKAGRGKERRQDKLKKQTSE